MRIYIPVFTSIATYDEFEGRPYYDIVDMIPYNLQLPEDSYIDWAIDFSDGVSKNEFEVISKYDYLKEMIDRFGLKRALIDAHDVVDIDVIDEESKIFGLFTTKDELQRASNQEVNRIIDDIDMKIGANINLDNTDEARKFLKDTNNDLHSWDYVAVDGAVYEIWELDDSVLHDDNYVLVGVIYVDV